MNQDKIWDYFQNECSESFESSIGRIKYIIKNIPKKTKILNIGVGGAILEKLALKKGIDIYSIDPSKKCIEKLKRIIGDNKAKVGYSQNIPFGNNYFDYVIMTEVLEHLEDEILDKTLKEVYRVLKKNGKFIGTVPYNENLYENIVVCPNCGLKFHRWGHVQSFNEKKLKNYLIKYFRIKKMKPMMFVSWNALNWKGKFTTSFIYIFYLLKIKKNGLNLYFEAIK